MRSSMKFLSLLIGTSLILSACSGEQKKDNEQTEEKASVVKVQKLEKQKIARELDFSTVLQAYDKVAVAPAMAGRIDKIMVEVGTWVSKGQLLARMDESNYVQAKVAFDNLAVDFDRVSKLNESDNISKQTYDQTKAQYEAQKTSLKNLEENTYLRAPFAGVIEAKNYEDGELYSGAPVVSLVQINNLKALVSIPESYFPLLKKGTPVIITSNIYPDQKFEAEIEIVYPTIDANTHTFQVQVKIPNGKQLLRPGMYSTASISFGEEEVMLVPYQAALKLQGSDSRYVFLNKNGVAERVSVKLGQRFDDQIEIIADGIKEGDELVVLGQARLDNGSKITINNQLKEE